MNPSSNNTDINTPLISSDSSQETNVPFQNNINYTNEILNRINKTPFFRIVFEPKKVCDNSTYISVYTLSTIDDNNPSNENQNFLFKAITKIDSCKCQDFEIKCYTGPHFNLANNYFCTFRIKKENWQYGPDLTLNPMIFSIAGNKLEINQETNEKCYGRIDRFVNTCNGIGFRKFFSHENNFIYQYQIGKPFYCECKKNCEKSCSCENCSCEKCTCDKCCEDSCECCVRKRYLFKVILDNTLNQCGEFNYVTSEQCCKEGFYEIKFPNDANVLMKLLLLGGLFDAAILPYFSTSENQKVINRSSNSASSLIFLFIYIISMTIILSYYIKITMDHYNSL